MARNPQLPVESALPGEETSERHFRTLEPLAALPRDGLDLVCSRRSSSYIQLRRAIFIWPCVAGELDADFVRFE